MKKILSILIVFGFISIPLMSCPQEKPPDYMLSKRFALIIGANDGGSGRLRLHFALDDAQSFLDVLEEMGGVEEGDAWLLAQPTRAQFFREMNSFAGKIEQAKRQFRRVEVFVYYSGHSDEKDLFLADERISYKELRDTITSLDADVRVAILDSCASGSFVQSKGVIRRSGFLLNSAYNMKGYAFISSSLDNEASQESKNLRGSFFTHNLVSGMRGAADMNLDGRITLTEAYQFAFDETLRQTEKGLHGPQHPNYYIQMSGTGDVVVTDISRSPALMVLSSDVSGKIYIHNKANVLVVELNKSAGREISIGLEQGEYRIILVDKSGIFETSISLDENHSTRLERREFRKAESIPTQSRGSLERPFPELQPERKRRWEISVFGGGAWMNPRDLNQRTEFDIADINYNLNQQFNYKRSTGEFTFYTNEINGELRKLRLGFLGGMCLQRSLNQWLSVSFELAAFSAGRKSNYENQSIIAEASGLQYIYNSNINDFTLDAQGLIPAIGLQAGKNLGRRLRGEIHLRGGPLFARCRYFSIFSDFPGSDFGDVYEEFLSEGTLEEKGRGTGIALTVGAGLKWLLRKNTGFILEADYAYRKVRRFSGPGWLQSQETLEEWSGEWWIKDTYREQPWGIFHMEFPSNYWPEDQLTRRLRRFELDLSGLEIRIGFFFRL